MEEKKVESNYVSNNHEFLFIYDATLCNPNGDPDNENKPRMDEEREINLVSDVRLKRYIRDYFYLYSEKKLDIYSRKGDNGETLTATGRIELLLNNYYNNNKNKNNDEIEKKDTNEKIIKIIEKIKKNKKNKKNNEINEDNNENNIQYDFSKLDEVEYKTIEEFILDSLIDLRMFGATIPIKSEKKGSSFTKTGPIQISWGYSLNPVTVNNFGITSYLGSEENKTQGAMGKDPRVLYSVIAFYGNIIAKKAEKTGLTESDIQHFDESIIRSILLSSTRSKIGQEPLLYLRIEYNNAEYLYGDLRKLIELKTNNNIDIKSIRNNSEIYLDITKLNKYLEDNINIIERINLWDRNDFVLCKIEKEEIKKKINNLKQKIN